MALQGWDFSDIIQNSRFGRFSDTMLLKLAGNAMNGFVLSYVLTGAVAFCDWDLAVAAQDAVFRAKITMRMHRS